MRKFGRQLAVSATIFSCLMGLSSTALAEAGAQTPIETQYWTTHISLDGQFTGTGTPFGRPRAIPINRPPMTAPVTGTADLTLYVGPDGVPIVRFDDGCAAAMVAKSNGATLETGGRFRLDYEKTHAAEICATENGNPIESLELELSHRGGDFLVTIREAYTTTKPAPGRVEFSGTGLLKPGLTQKAAPAATTSTSLTTAKPSTSTSAVPPIDPGFAAAAQAVRWLQYERSIKMVEGTLRIGPVPPPRILKDTSGEIYEWRVPASFKVDFGSSTSDMERELVFARRGQANFPFNEAPDSICYEYRYGSKACVAPPRSAAAAEEVHKISALWNGYAEAENDPKAKAAAKARLDAASAQRLPGAPFNSQDLKCIASESVTRSATGRCIRHSNDPRDILCKEYESKSYSVPITVNRCAKPVSYIVVCLADIVPGLAGQGVTTVQPGQTFPPNINGCAMSYPYAESHDR